jgi:hypothetical protein
VVPVITWADESVTGHPGWRGRVRALWRGVSDTLGPILDTAYVPVSIRTFSSVGADDRLASIDREWRLAQAPAPPQGILAGFTERGVPRQTGTWRLGQADFVGRRLLVRLEPGATASRPLVHELLHLYGAVHVADDLPSIMNPSGGTSTLDPGNARIVEELRLRRFIDAGPAVTLLENADAGALTEAYAAALRRNLSFRRLGVIEGLAARSESRILAAQKIRAAASLDDHLGDVSRFLAQLLLAQQRVGEAADLLEIASILYGLDSSQGRESARDAEALRRATPDGGG